MIKKVLSVWKNEGLDILWYKVKLRFARKDYYAKWIKGNERNIMVTKNLSYNPMFSVVIPVYNVADNMLRECIDSVLNQTYKNFEVVLVDDASTQDSVRTVLAEYENRSNIKVIYRGENGHISRATNDGIDAASGEFIALCDCDDLYAPNALYEVAKKLNEDPELDFIYSDEDKIDENGRKRRDPFFKPDWSPETFMSYMYTCHLSVYRKSLLDKVGGLRVGFEGSQDYDLVLRIMEQTTHIGHIPKILYHWRMRKESTASAMTAKPYIMEATRKAKEEALERRNLVGRLSTIADISQIRVTYVPQGNPLVSIVIPSKDNFDVLKQCLSSIVKITAYENYEIVLVDNGSSEAVKGKIEGLISEFSYERACKGIKYIYEPMEFNFSKMCNMGADAANGELILFLNDDIEITEEVKKNPLMAGEPRQWLSILAGQAQVSYTGAVGCKLYYPNSIRFQHAGVLNLPIGPGHSLYGYEDNLNYYYGRNLLDYNYAVVTGACLMVERKKFDEVGRFDEDMPVTYNDVALCFKLLEAGYHNVLRNDVALIHHESVSRGLDEQSAAKEERRRQEMAKLYEKHPKFDNGYDPCYNPNLVGDRGDFAYNMNNAMVPEKPKKLRDKDMPGFVKLDAATSAIKGNIELCQVVEDTIHVGGWAYDANRKNNNHNKVRVILKSNDKTYIVPAVSLYRGDVVREDGTRKGLSITGFKTVMYKKTLPKGRYKVGIAIGKVYVMYENFVEV